MAVDEKHIKKHAHNLAERRRTRKILLASQQLQTLVGSKTKKPDQVGVLRLAISCVSIKMSVIQYHDANTNRWVLSSDEDEVPKKTPTKSLSSEASDKKAFVKRC